MDSETKVSERRGRGRPPQYLLSALAVCGVCGAGVRIGTQNPGKRKPGNGSKTSSAPRYRVYECPGSPGGGGGGFLCVDGDPLRGAAVGAAITTRSPYRYCPVSSPAVTDATDSAR
ncbi:hypothetical protein [Arthrobacter sp. 2MCAF14]|uniref:hypothetical protein n=1 Tax=Arthrobacter sp. 2MCAF14 TaxID=3232982 RepID=UPI003F920BDF